MTFQLSDALQSVESILNSKLGNEGCPNKLESWRARLCFLVYERFCSMYCSKIWELIRDFPMTSNDLEDLCVCLEKTQRYDLLAFTLSDAIQRRLLHPGAATSDIITQYISTIKVLHILDPSCVVLEAVVGPIRTYLRSRTDTVRCVIQSLTGDESSGDLWAELQKTDKQRTFEEGLVEDSDVEEDEGDILEWQPQRVDAGSYLSGDSLEKHEPSILSTLVGIYGSRELFLQEYRTLLAERLLVLKEYDIERELRNIELLKLRFGEASLLECDVMVTDIANSRWINSSIHSSLEKQNLQSESSGCDDISNKNKWFNSSVISSYYWPSDSLSEESQKIKLPDSISEIMSKYEKEFSISKAPRELVWLNNLGIVEIDLELGGIIESFTVSPIHACIIKLFESNNIWTVSQIAQELDISCELIAKNILFWEAKGLLKRTTQSDIFVFQLNTEFFSQDFI